MLTGPTWGLFWLSKMPTPTILAFAAPCFPGLLVSYSEILHGSPVGWSPTGRSMYEPIFNEPSSAGLLISQPIFAIYLTFMTRLLEMGSFYFSFSSIDRPTRFIIVIPFRHTL